jgi:hypothetical protein
MSPKEIITALMQIATLTLEGQGAVRYGNDFQVLDNLDKGVTIIVLPFNAQDDVRSPALKRYDCLVLCVQSVDGGQGSEYFGVKDAECLEILYRYRNNLETLAGLRLTVAATYNVGYVVEGQTHSGATAKFTIANNYSEC